MKLVYPGINHVINTEIDGVNELVIENQKLFCEVLNDIYTQLQGLEGNCVLSKDNKVLELGKYLEVLTQFVPFDMNRKTLLTKITAAVEKKATEDECFLLTAEVMGRIEKYLLDLCYETNEHIEFSKLTIGTIIKAVGITLADDYDDLGEKISDYMELVNEFEREKLYVMVNLRSYLSDKKTEQFLQTVMLHGYQVLLLENCERSLLSNEKRCLVDANLCEIC